MGEELEAAERVRVVVRVRPRNEREQQSSSLHTLTVDDAAGQIHVCKKKGGREVERELHCTYDRVFDEKTDQADVFGYLRDGVQQVAQGFNCTIFAYGQTGTGKTHTMLGKDLERHLDGPSPASDAAGCSPNWGVIPRAVESLFEELRSISRQGSAGVVHCSYMQIYNNDVFDLLQDSKHRMKDSLPVREMIKGNGKQIYVSGLSEFRVTSLQETLQLLKVGNRNRTIRSTEYNEKSSRSHALLQLSIEVESRGLESATTIIRRAKLSLVDLAGSEKWDTDIDMQGDRCRELTSINQSLSALGNVISALTNPRRTHVPYRDSKLTRLLQDSLGGNTRTVVIATISPSESALEETISTLQFADRAKCVAVRVKANELVDDAILLAQAQREISRLKLLLKQKGAQAQVTTLEEQVARLMKEKAALAAENQKLRHTVVSLRKASSTISSAGVKTTPLLEAANKREDAASLLPSRPTPPAHEIKVTNDDDRPQSASSLQLNQLRLDLSGLGAESKAKPEVSTAFADEAAENERLQQAAKAQERVLQEIQTERRELERQLELLAVTDCTNSQQGVRCDQTNGNEEEELCPICGKNIDRHSDEALDRCIELETMKQPRPVQPQNPPARNPQDVNIVPVSTGTRIEGAQTANNSGPPAESIPRQVAAGPRIRRVSTSAHGKISPYLTEVVRKPSTPPQVRTFGKPRSGDIRAASQAPGSNGKLLSAERASPPVSDNNNQTDSHPAASLPPQAAIPILRQGHKGLKALKKFRASSPYNNSTLCKDASEKRTPSPSARTESSSSPSPADADGGDNNRLTTTIVNSVRDIGLQLNVYKFRYDCWYACTIVGFDRKRRMHCCQYDCGDKQWQDLSERKVQVIGRTEDSD